MNCKRCGARLPRGMAICPECGARQRLQAGRVRCAQCGKRALADLTVCPHCGRTLRPAGPRWGLWLTGAVAIVLAGMVTLNALPLRAAWQQAVHLQERLASLVQIPELPAAPSPAATVRAASTATATAPALRTPASTPKASGALSVTLTVIRPTATASSTPPAGSPAAASTASAAATQAPTQAPTATATPVPASPTPVPATATPTATPAPATATPTGDTTRYYTVKAGDTFIDIGNATGMPWEDIAAYNGMTSRSLLLPGMKLKLPPGPGTAQPAGPTATPAAQRKYRVQAGDSLMVIAAKFGVPWDSIAQANGLTASSMLQVGQELIIPAN